MTSKNTCAHGVTAVRVFLPEEGKGDRMNIVNNIVRI